MDEFQVIYTDTFLADLRRAVEFVAIQNPEAAQKLGLAILRVCDSLALFPERYPRLRQRPTVRRVVVQKYIKVFYRVRRETRLVQVLRCWDGRQGSDPKL